MPLRPGRCIEHAGKAALLGCLGVEDRETVEARIAAAAKYIRFMQIFDKCSTRIVPDLLLPEEQDGFPK